MSELSNKILKLIALRGMSYSGLSAATGIPKSALQRYATGGTEKIPLERLNAIAKALGVSAAELTGWFPSGSAPSAQTGRVPVLGMLPEEPAGGAEYIEGYEPVGFSDADNYFYLRVRGDSMINAGINDGDLALIRLQSFADNGQIVACLAGGGEGSALKRFKRQGDLVLLLPENPAYDPLVLPASDFENGRARIIGVMAELKRKYD